MEAKWRQLIKILTKKVDGKPSTWSFWCLLRDSNARPAVLGTQGRRPVFHDLRHTYATIAVRTMDIKSAQDILGHSDINMTMRYADTDLEQIQKAGKIIGEALNDANKEGAEVLQMRRAI